VIRAIVDCVAVFASKIGSCPKESLKGAGIEPVDGYAHQHIEKSVLDYFKKYVEKVRDGEIVHLPRKDAEIRSGALVSAELAGEES
jgi:nitrogen fixation protein NifB